MPSTVMFTKQQIVRQIYNTISQKYRSADVDTYLDLLKRIAYELERPRTDQEKIKFFS